MIETIALQTQTDSSKAKEQEIVFSDILNSTELNRVIGGRTPQEAGCEVCDIRKKKSRI